MKRIVSGIKPTGSPHIGNYFGMMKPSIELSRDNEAFYFIADNHALTTIHSPHTQTLRENSRNIAIDFIALGLDPKNSNTSIIFKQSDVYQHTELAWILGCFTPLAMLLNCHAYKANTSINHGTFSYPVLMAADILLYNTNYVPVGVDQKQHIEVTRDIANIVNKTHKNLFVIPEPLILQNSSIIGLDGRKMSKSYNNTIAIFEDEKNLRKKIMGIKTNSAALSDPKDVNSSILELYKLFAQNQDVSAMTERFLRSGDAGIGYGVFKKELFEVIWEYFRPFREKRHDLVNAPDYIDSVLRNGADKARHIASVTIKKVKDAVGF